MTASAPAIVDMSAIVAIVKGNRAQVLKEALERSPYPRMSAPNYLCAIMQRRDRPEIFDWWDRHGRLESRSKPSTPTLSGPAAARRRIATTAPRQRPSGPSQPRGDTLQLRPGPVTGSCFVAMTAYRYPGPRAPEPRLRYIRYMYRG